MSKPLDLALLKSSGALVIETRPSLLRKMSRTFAELRGLRFRLRHRYALWKWEREYRCDVKEPPF